MDRDLLIGIQAQLRSIDARLSALERRDADGKQMVTVPRNLEIVLQKHDEAVSKQVLQRVLPAIDMLATRVMYKMEDGEELLDNYRRNADGAQPMLTGASNKTFMRPDGNVRTIFEYD